MVEVEHLQHVASKSSDESSELPIYEGYIVFYGGDIGLYRIAWGYTTDPRIVHNHALRRV